MTSTTITDSTRDAITDAGPDAAPRWQRVALVLAVAELVLLYAPTIQWLFERWTISVWQNAHGMLIPPVAGYFAYQELQRHRELPRSSSRWGFAFLGPALALHALDAGMHTQLLSAASLVLALPGLSLLLLGVPRTKAIAFPLAFMVFALPIPLAFTESVTWQLRQIATAGAASIVPLLGVPVFVEGTTLHLPKGALQIADACSGFSTLYASMAVAFLLAYMAQSTTRRLVLLFVAAPLAIAANLLRVVALVMLVTSYGNEILDTFIHPLSGMLTFALALPVLFWLGAEPQKGRA